MYQREFQYHMTWLQKNHHWCIVQMSRRWSRRGLPVMRQYFVLNRRPYLELEGEAEMEGEAAVLREGVRRDSTVLHWGLKLICREVASHLRTPSRWSSTTTNAINFVACTFISFVTIQLCIHLCSFSWKRLMTAFLLVCQNLAQGATQTLEIKNIFYWATMISEWLHTFYMSLFGITF